MTIEFYVAMNEEGDWEVHSEPDDAINTLTDNLGSGYAIRLVKFTVQMKPPICDEVEIEVPASAGKLVEAKAE